MPPTIALIACIVFILLLFIRERNKESHQSVALWIPLIWLILSGTRFVSEMLYPLGTRASLDEGSSLDAAVFICLMTCGVLVLSKRKILWAQLFQKNLCLFFFIGYSGISVIWSDFPFVAFKRWFKEIGNLIMVIIILSDNNYIGSIKFILKKLSYVLIPLSIVLIKYFPEYGRTYSEWTGEVQYRGVGGNKNYLGFICLSCGYFYMWMLSVAKQYRASIIGDKIDTYICVIFLLMVFWLFEKANSVTSLMAFIAGLCTLFLLKAPSVKNNIRSIGTIAFVACLSICFMILFGIDEVLIPLSGRESTLTDRVPLWEDILALVENPIIGFGYNSFWLGDRPPVIWRKWSWHPVNTHNGYLDVYVNLGYIGLIILIAVIFSTFIKVKKELLNNYEYGRFCIGWLVVTLLYNISETAFAGIQLIWIIFLLVAVDYPAKTVRYEQSK